MTKFQKIIALCAVEFVFLFACYVVSIPFLGTGDKEISMTCAFLAAASGIALLIAVVVIFQTKERH